MHKSIIIFLGLLVVLLPFGTSMNIFSNAMALNIVPSMNNDEQDYLQKYEKFYKDNSFRETYYNYHKQHHHQQEQQQQQQNQESRYNDNYDDNEKSSYNYNNNNDDKSKDNVIGKKVKCNNFNVNVNGLELNGFPPFLGNLTSDGQDGYGGASSYESGNGRSYGDGQSSSDGDFKFICINNNNNTVIEG